MEGKNPTMSVFAPLTGKVIDLSDVKGAREEDKDAGDGVAIIPDEGSLYSPVSGYVVEVPNGNNHAFKFETEDGINILVQVGIGIEKLGDKPISTYVKEGSKVQAGDLVAEIDLNKITMGGCDTTTMVLICGGMEGIIMHPGAGHVLAGAGAIFTLEDMRDASPEEIAAAEEKAAEERAIAMGKPIPEKKKKKAVKKKKKKAENDESAEAAEENAEDEITDPKEARIKAVKDAESDALAFLKKPGSVLKIGLALLVITVLLVSVFVSVAMFMSN